MALDSISNFFGSNLTKKIKPKTWTLVSWVLFNYIKASCLSLLKKNKNNTKSDSINKTTQEV